MAKKQNLETNKTIYKIFVDKKSDMYIKCEEDIGNIKPASVAQAQSPAEWYISRGFDDIYSRLKSIDGVVDLRSQCMDDLSDHCTFQISEGNFISVKKAVTEIDEQPILLIVHTSPKSKDQSQPIYLTDIITDYKAILHPNK